MNKNLILFSTAVFVRSNSNHDHTLITKIMPDLISTGFEIFVAQYFADHPDEYKEA